MREDPEVRRRKQREQKKAIYEKRVATGRCITCGKKAVTGRCRCAACAKVASARAANYKKRVDAACFYDFVCNRCQTREVMPGRVSCDACSDAHTEHQRALRDRYRAKGLCTGCGRKRDRKDRIYCASCQEKNRARKPEARARQIQRLAKIREGRRARGLCPQCGGARDIDGRDYCSLCLERNRRYDLKHRQKEKQTIQAKTAKSQGEAA